MIKIRAYMSSVRLILFLLISLLFSLVAAAEKIENCKWDNRGGIPCISVSKTPNTSDYSIDGINKTIITKEEIIKSGAIDTIDILKSIQGLDVFQSGQKGQQTSIFTRGSESNHTLVLLNGIPINDQSTTDGLHDFGQDFIQTIQQIEVYKGANGAHFGPSAIAGAINFVTDIEYKNSFSVSGFDEKNNSINANYTKITENDWHLNFKGALNRSKTDSAIALGNEDDGVKNHQINLNAKKWINENLKLKSTIYSRKTKADYDDSATKEADVTSNNEMYAIQTGLEQKSMNSEDILTLHYHNYDRKYNIQGKRDIYYSESLVTKGEKKLNYNKKLSFGYGGEYKYDWGHFNKKSWVEQTKGHIKNFGIFANAGYKFNGDQILSIYGRSDDHNTTGENQTYKVNFLQYLNKLKFGITHSTGLRNPSLYELYGGSSSYSGNTELKPEKSSTNEIFGEYNISENIKFRSTAYETEINDRIELNSSWSQYENKSLNINQEGLESSLNISGNKQNISISSNFSKSRNDAGGHQNRRPDLSYGVNYSKSFNDDRFGPFDLNMIYKYTGRYRDWDGSGNSFQKSTDLLDLSINKNWYGSTITINISNLLNERYEKPATYTQDGRQIRFGFKKSF